MRINRQVITITLVSIVFSTFLGCQQQKAATSATEQVEQKTHLDSKAVQTPKNTQVQPTVVSDTKQTSPKISFEKKVYDLGKVGAKERKNCEFKFKNIGDGLLKIGKIKTTCGCTVATLSKRE